MSLRARLACAVAAAVAVLVTAGGALFISQLDAGLDASLDATLRARADALVQKVSPDGTTNFQDSGGGGLLPPGQALAQVVSPQGAVVDSSQGTGRGRLLSSVQLKAARQAPISFTTTLTSGGSVRLLAVPVPGAGSKLVVIVVGTSRVETQNALDRVRAGLVVGGLLAVGLSGVGAWGLAAVALRPVERMRRQAAEISVRDNTARLAVPTTHDEVARLAETMNALLERLQQALTRQRNLVADAGHELRTPLTTLRAELELANRSGRGREELASAVGRAAEETDRLIGLSEDLLMLAHADDGAGSFLRKRSIRLDHLIREALSAASAGAERASVSLVTSEGLLPVTVDADADRLRQVLDNVLSNAVRFTPTGGSIDVRLDVPDEQAGRVIVEVLDDGPGFPDAFLPHAFERFRRGDQARTPHEGGAGLGLAIVAALVGAHNGVVTVSNRKPTGACVRLELPSATRSVSTHRLATPSSHVRLRRLGRVSKSTASRRPR